MDSKPPVLFGLTGLGGYAGYVCDRLLEEAHAASPAAKLLAVCEPHLDRFAARVQALRSRGVQVLERFDQLLDINLDAVWLPLPIDLHRAFTEQALAAGKAVLCEKPAAGCVDDVDAMIAARDRAGRTVAVGFQDAYQPAVAELKQRLMAGEFGRALGVRVIGCWPRGARYFGRNDWAGRLCRDGRWILDGPAGNALAHFIHLPMLLLGESLQQACTATDVAAEMYRVNDIESYDTCSLRLTLDGQIPMVVAYTHACDTSVEPVVTIELERGTIRYLSGRHVEIDSVGGGSEDSRGSARVQQIALSAHPHRHMLGVFQRWMQEGTETALGATLESARAHVVAMNAAMEAAPIHEVPAEFVQTVPARDHQSIRVIRDIVPAMQECIARRCLLHETGSAPWTSRAAVVHIDGYHHFAGPHGIDAAALPTASAPLTTPTSTTAAAAAAAPAAATVSPPVALRKPARSPSKTTARV